MGAFCRAWERRLSGGQHAEAAFEGTPQTMEALEPRLLLSGGVAITEFMADNESVLADVDGDYPDWIELYNGGAEAVNLEGWYLTDDPTLSDLWRIPALTIPAGGYEVVFASDKNRADPAGELHTDFKLSADGEYLALVGPDAQTVQWEYAPEFPRQIEDISYGPPFDAGAVETTVLVGEGADARVWVPTDGSAGAAWCGGAGFDDSAWSAASSAIGYERNEGDDTSYAGYFDTDLESAMYGAASSAYVRIPFLAEDPAALTSLTLRLRYDDGFVAYLNGVEIARANANDPVAWDSVASTSRPDSLALAMAEFDATAAIPALVEGENILAIHALNRDATSSDFLLSAELLAETPAPVGSEAVYFVTPTPGLANISGVLGVVDDTVFSVDRGFYDAPFLLEIATDTPEAEIRYTTDGSTPTAAHGTVYDGPILIDGQTVLRAAAFRPGYAPSNVDTQTYIFLDDVLAQPDNPAGYPTVWNGDYYTRPADYGMDPEVVNDPAYADLMEDSLTSIPTISITTDIANLFDPDTGIYIKATRDGMENEVPVSVEYFDAAGEEEFQIDCGLRMRGGASRNQRTTPKHSFRLIFRDMYGAGKLNYDLFGDGATDSFDTIVLRAGSNLSWAHHNGWPVYSENRIYAQYIRDQWAKDTQRAMGWDSPHNNYAHLYINGMYWGLYNPGERPSAPYASAYEGGDKDDYDVINSGEAIDGDTVAWNQMINLGLSGLADSDHYAQMTEMLDVEAFADYMIINQYGGNFDWDHHNWHAYRNREADGKWYFAMWDTEIIFVRLHDNRIDPAKFGQYEPSSSYNSSANILTRLWLQLMENDEFKMLFADRIHKHLFNDGVLTPERVIETWDVRSDEVYEAILSESARWGDYRRDVYYAGRASFDDRRLYDRDEEWVDERDRLMNEYFPYRTDVVIGQYEAFGAYPSAAAPEFQVNGAAQHGGVIAAGDTLSMEAESGLILYTLDGTDPRASGGGVSGGAAVFTPGMSLPLEGDLLVKARVYENGQWSALTEAIYETAEAPTLAITEVNYHPVAPTAAEQALGFIDDDAFEFIELCNTGDEAVDLRTVAFAAGVEFSFADGAAPTLTAGEYVVVVRDLAAFRARYGAAPTVAGVFGGGLDNGGESIALAHGAGTEFIRFTYDDDGAWSGRADGKGATLELIDSAADVDDPDNWRASAEYLGSPGAAGSGLNGDVLINEVLSHTDGEPTDSIELVNTTDAAIDIGGWFLSDTAVRFQKFRIPDGTVLAPGAYVVFDEHDFNATGLTLNPDDDDPDDFGLSGAYGDDVWLMAADETGVLTRFVDHVEFGAAANGESFGRWPDAVGELAPMTAVSLGAANPGPRVGPVVISEVMVDPSDLENLPSQEILAADFDADADGFVYQADLFGTNNAACVTGAYLSAAGASGGGLSVMLQYGHTDPASGGWSSMIDMPTAGVATISLQYNLVMTGGYDLDEYAEVVLTVDGQRYGDDVNGSLLHVAGDGPDTALTMTDWVTATVEVSLDAGVHTLAVGAYVNSGGSYSDVTRVLFDDVQVSAGVDPGDLEFIEIHNPTAEAVDLTGWRIRKGVEYDFDPGVILPADGRVVVLSFNPAKVGNEKRVDAFRQVYGIDESVVLVGGYDGALNNGGEDLQLQRPDAPPAEDPEFTPYLVEDDVVWDDVASWPAGGAGLSLQRVSSDAWGLAAASWVTAAPTPGSAAAPLLPGDFDNSGKVDIADFIILKNNFGLHGSATWALGDATGDGNVDILDFIVLKNNFGSSRVSTAAAVPETDGAAVVVAPSLVSAGPDSASSPLAEMVGREPVRRRDSRGGRSRWTAPMDLFDLCAGRRIGVPRLYRQ